VHVHVLMAKLLPLLLDRRRPGSKLKGKAFRYINELEGLKFPAQLAAAALGACGG